MTVDEMYPPIFIEDPEDTVIIFHTQIGRHYRCKAATWYNLRTYGQLFAYAKNHSQARYCSGVTVWKETMAGNDLLLAEYKDCKIVFEMCLRYKGQLDAPSN